MNADATPGVDLDVSVGVNSNWIPVTLVLLLLGGAFCVGAASVMSYYAYRRTVPAVADGATPQVTDQPLIGSESDTSG